MGEPGSLVAVRESPVVGDKAAFGMRLELMFFSGSKDPARYATLSF